MNDSTIDPTADVEAELLSAEVMDTDQAHRLDSRIRLLSNTIGDNLTKLTDLIAEAKRGQIHLALGFPSWTAYLSSALSQLEMALAGPARRELVTLLADEGMSNRAIAQAVGVSEITVRRDKEQVRHDVAPDESETAAPVACPPSPRSPKLEGRRDWAGQERSNVVGLDGKTYTPPRIKSEVSQRDGIDELVDWQMQNARGPGRWLGRKPRREPPRREPRRRPITDAFPEQVRKVYHAAESLERLSRDDRFGRNVNALSCRLSDLIRARDALDRIIARFDATQAARRIAADRTVVEVVDGEVVDSGDAGEE